MDDKFPKIPINTLETVLKDEANGVVNSVNLKNGHGYFFYNTPYNILSTRVQAPFIIIPNNNPLYDKLRNEPLRVYGLPLFLVTGDDGEQDSHCILIERVQSMIKDDTGLLLEGVKFYIVDNLQFFELVQKYRWIYPDENTKEECQNEQ